MIPEPKRDEIKTWPLWETSSTPPWSDDTLMPLDIDLTILMDMADNYLKKLKKEQANDDEQGST